MSLYKNMQILTFKKKRLKKLRKWLGVDDIVSTNRKVLRRLQ